MPRKRRIPAMLDQIQQTAAEGQTTAQTATRLLKLASDTVKDLDELLEEIETGKKRLRLRTLNTGKGSVMDFITGQVAECPVEVEAYVTEVV